MANTFTIIASNTLGSSTNTVTFSGIPATYDDLCFKISSRGTSAGWNYFNVTFNGVSTSTYTYQEIYGSGTAITVGSSSATPATSIQAATNTIPSQDTFLWGVAEFYIPNYRVSQGKQILVYGAGERNVAEAYTALGMGYSAGTDAITSVTFQNLSSNWVANSTFYLYGISKS